MREYQIAVLKGDGIGPEIVDEAIRVLGKAGEKFGFAMHYAEGAIASFLQGGYWYQPLIAALVGLIPNCASSVLVTQAYLLDALSFGGMAAGLCANAGLGFVILFKNTRRWKRNLLLLAVMYAVSVAVGYAVSAVMLAF